MLFLLGASLFVSNEIAARGELIYSRLKRRQMFHVNLFGSSTWVLFIMCPSRASDSSVRNLARAHSARGSLILLFGKCHWQFVRSHVSWLSVTEVVFAFNPVEVQREWIFPVPSALIKITLAAAIGPW